MSEAEQPTGRELVKVIAVDSPSSIDRKVLLTVTPARKGGLVDAGLGPLLTRYWALTLHFTFMFRL